MAEHFEMRRGAFALEGKRLHQLDLAPIPCDRKRPLIRNWQNKKLSRQRIEKLAIQHATANVGIVCGLSGIVVVDVDDPALLGAMIERFGPTPMIVKTPSGGFHLYYREGSLMKGTNLRQEGLEVDIQAGAKHVVAPPSRHPETGIEYTFVKGDWSCLPDLPVFRTEALGPTKAQGAKGVHRAGRKGAKRIVVGATIIEGQRNNALFNACMLIAREVTTVTELISAAQRFNRERNSPPLPDAEVECTARSAWGYQSSGHNWLGSSGVVPVSKELALRLAGAGTSGSDAIPLYVLLRIEHAKREEPFAVSPRAMARDGTIPNWTEYRYRRALQVLRDFRLVQLVKEGGRGPGDVSLYVLREEMGSTTKPERKLDLPFKTSSASRIVKIKFPALIDGVPDKIVSIKITRASMPGVM